MQPEAVGVTEELLFNPLDPSFRTNPVATYDRLRTEAPAYRTQLGGWVLSKYADCQVLLHHSGTSHDPRNSELWRMTHPASGDEELWQQRRSFLFMDPPDHTRLRGLVSKAFTARVIEAMRPRIQEVVDELIERVIEKGSLELIEDIAYPLPVTIISEMLGVPAEDEDVFKGWSKILARSLDPEPFIDPETLRQREEAADEFRAYFTKLIDSRRKDPKDDLLSALVSAEEQGDKLTHDELLSTLILLLIAGHETTVNLIGNGGLALLRNPDQLTKLGEEPRLARSAVEEVLRYDPPVMFTGRTAMEDIELPGVTIAKGESALTLIGAANRDPDQFEAADKFDITRSPNPHLAFGMGIHFCLGAPLARVEGQITLATLAQRLPQMMLETDQPEYRENIVLRGLAALPIAV